VKIFEYAKNRNVKSKEVVNKLHDLGFKHIKNHLSLVPEKVIEQLDAVDFEKKVKEKKHDSKTIAYISMECAPFASIGLGDMVRHKVQYNSFNGNQNIVIMPKYNMDIKVLNAIMDINISINHQNKTGRVYHTNYDNASYYLIDSEYFNRDQLYGYYDDAERFAFLTKASIEIIKKLDLNVDLINVHDWPLGLFPIIFENSLKDEFVNTKIEFSVYGATYQGIYGIEVLTDVFELDKKYYDDHIVEYANSVNFLKSGLVTADKVDINKVALNDLKNSYLKEFVYDNM